MREMLLRKLLLLPFAFVVVLSGRVIADPVSKEHGHKTPHGGIVNEAGGMHAEFLLDKSGQPKFYLYDKAMKPLEKTDFQARLTVKGHDGTQHNRELKASKDPKEGVVYKGEPIKGVSDWDTAVVSLKMKDGWTHFRFSHH
jgi:VCBS repeat-containing protein